MSKYLIYESEDDKKTTKSSRYNTMNPYIINKSLLS